MFIDGQNKKRFRVHIDDIWVNNPAAVADNGLTCFRVYPNPTNGILTVSGGHSTEYYITNMLGQILIKGQVDDEPQQINVEMLPKGMYLITIGDSKYRFVRK